MDKKKIEGIIWFAVGLILILLLANKSNMSNDNIKWNFINFWKNDVVYSNSSYDIRNNHVFL